MGFALQMFSHFFKYLREHEIILCHCDQIMRPNYFIFIGYVKTGMWRDIQANPLNPSGSATIIKLELS